MKLEVKIKNREKAATAKIHIKTMQIRDQIIDVFFIILPPIKYFIDNYTE